jgi:alkyl hydroperoxide reductase subunit F
MPRTFDVVIIGAGPAGMSAAIYCTRKGLKTMIIGKDVGGQVAKSGEIQNYLGYGATTGADLVQLFHEHVKGFENIVHEHGILVTDVTQKGDSFIVKTEKEELEAEAVIIASGRTPRKLGIPGEEEFNNKGVSYCDVCDGPLFSKKDVAVVGGGNSGLEAALSLSKICKSVAVINLTDDLTGDETLRKKIKDADNVTIYNNAKTKEVAGETFVKELVYEDKDGNEKRLSVQGVFIEVGYVPKSDFEKLSTKDDSNRIVINKNCETNVPGLFAAGDVTDIRDNQVIIASGEGAKAALSTYYYLAHK